MESLGGTKLAENLVSAAESYAARFARRQLDAAKTKLQAERERRKKEWEIEDEIFDAEVVEIEKQEVINEIKTQQVEKQHKNIENEILRSEQAYEMLSEKFTNNELYVWLEKELGKVFRRYVNLLVEVAKMAERAYLFEIEGRTDVVYNFIKNDYWDNFRKGLLAPEKILLDLRQMEKAYLEKCEHGIKITKPILLIPDLSNVQTSSGALTIKTVSSQNSSSELVVTFEITSDYFTNDFKNSGSKRIYDVWLQVIDDGSNEWYKSLNAEISLTSEHVFLSTWASSMALSEAGKYSFVFSDEKYSPFEGTSLERNTEWNLRLSGLENINNKAAVKVVLFVSYIMGVKNV